MSPIHSTDRAKSDRAKSNRTKSDRPRTRAALRRLRTPAAILALAALTACAGADGRYTDDFGSARTTIARYDDAHPIAVEIQPLMLDIPADRPLSARDQARIDAFARDFVKRGEGDLTIAYPRNGDSARLVREIAARAETIGVPARRLTRGPYATEVDGDRGVVVSFYAAAAVASHCPSPQGDTVQSWNNEQSFGFGCTTQNNLAAMLADPRDLTRPRPMSPISSERRQQVLKAYQAGDATASDQNGQTTDTRNQ